MPTEARNNRSSRRDTRQGVPTDARWAIERTILKGQLLVAMPQLNDPNFKDTVVLLCEHGESGALGLVVNRPTPYQMAQVYEGQGIVGTGGAEEPIHYGGPVQTEMGFVLHEGGDYDGSFPVLEGLDLGTSLDILRDIASGQGPVRFLFFLGYAGWAPDQLESEISRNDWLVVPGSIDLLFNIPATERRERAIRSLGIDPALLSQGFGTA